MKSFSFGPIREFVDLVAENQRPGMLVAEIGVYDGSTTHFYAPIVSANGGRVHCVDTFAGTKPLDTEIIDASNPHFYGPHNDDLLDRFKRNMEEHLGCIDIHHMRSDEAASFLPNDLDIVFIDADHTYKCVKRDIELYLPKVKRGGILCGHDCESFEFVNEYTESELLMDVSRGTHPGVSQAVFERFGITELRGNVWIVRV